MRRGEVLDSVEGGGVPTMRGWERAAMVFGGVC